MLKMEERSKFSRCDIMLYIIKVHKITLWVHRYPTKTHLSAQGASLERGDLVLNECCTTKHLGRWGKEMNMRGRSMKTSCTTQRITRWWLVWPQTIGHEEYISHKLMSKLCQSGSIVYVIHSHLVGGGLRTSHLLDNVRICKNIYAEWPWKSLRALIIYK